MKRQMPALTHFTSRWFICSIGLYIAAGLTSSISYNSNIGVIIVSGLILAAINSFIKPLLIILTLPAVLLSMGLFMIIINGLTVLIAAKLYHPLHINGFWSAVFAGAVIGLVNYLVSIILKDLIKSEYI